MGAEIESSHFSPADLLHFQSKLKEETALLRRWLERDSPCEEEKSSGIELEGWLIDQNCLPCPVNESFLKILDCPKMVPELSRFNIEYNSQPYSLQPQFLSTLHRELEEVFAQTKPCAAQLDSKLLWIGILPTLRPNMLGLENMSPSHRYYALNHELRRHRQGRPFHLDIRGEESLTLQHENVMLESATTSLQIHLQIPIAQARRFFNAALLVSGPMLGVSANSPFLFDRALWEETRIPLFEQAVDLQALPDPNLPELGRVSFGSGFVKKSWIELFEENERRFPVLLPLELSAEEGALPHLRLHNGTIWRWNRPIVEVDPQGQLHLRIEHRVAASGPSLPDVLGNCAFFLGLIHGLAEADRAPEETMEFFQARENFYAAARNGLAARLHWGNKSGVAMLELLKEDLLPLARLGLESLGFDKSEIQYYLDEVVGERLRKQQTGAAWQKKFIVRHGRDFPALTQSYSDWQESGKPVHQWSL